MGRREIMKTRIPVSSKKSQSLSPAPQRKPPRVDSRSNEEPLFRPPDHEADRIILRQIALEFMETGSVPSAYTFEEIERMMSENRFADDEKEGVVQGLAQLVNVLKEVAGGKK
jgi:hypothetical protein